MRLEHTRCDVYRGCDACNRWPDRWESILFALGVLFVFTFVIPVVPVLVGVIISLFA